MKLADLIAFERTQWDDPVVDRAVFDDIDPRSIEAQLNAFCVGQLKTAIANTLFYKVSVGCVAGLVLEDGRAVVMKLQRAYRSEAYLRACCDLRDHLRERGFPCPKTVLGPTRLGPSWVTIETLEDSGQWRDGHDPVARAAIARALAEIVELSRSFDDGGAFGRSWFTAVPDDRTFPRPHSPLFDFEGTQEGAEWIADLAARARERRSLAAGDRVVGHYDLRVEHVRFDGDRIVATYDWDSLHRDHEPVLVGVIAMNYPADWQRADVNCSPSLAELRWFVAEYEAARGVPFTEVERRMLAGSAVYAMAYRARCSHALSPEGPRDRNDGRALLADLGEVILAEGL